MRNRFNKLTNHLLSVALAITVCSGSLLAAQTNLAKSWNAVIDLYGNHLHQQLLLTADGNSLHGTLGGNPLNGTLKNNQIHFIATDQRRTTYEVQATLEKEAISGNIKVTDPNQPQVHVQHAFTARALSERPQGPPRLIEFKPTKFYNQFSADTPPAITIWPGDTVHTTTVDSGGIDEHGVTQALYGNPQTGPFYIGGAQPGDILAIHLKRLRLNRDYADSLDSIANRVKNPDLAIKAKDLGNPVRWKLDLQRGVATPQNATGHLKNFTVPLRPMMGCIAVAPGFGFAPFSTGDAGKYGGNMDFNEIVEGSTVYLLVTQPGALLYLGDGHAAMGDGETSEWALETSMDVEFSVDIIPHKFIRTPRVETATDNAAIGIAGSVDDAMRMATSGMVQWLEQDYGLTPSESAQVLGSAAQYTISEIADRDASVVLKLRKDLLKNIAVK